MSDANDSWRTKRQNTDLALLPVIAFVIVSREQVVYGQVHVQIGSLKKTRRGGKNG